MKIIGMLIIGGVILWLVVVTFAYIWWIWLILIGFIFLALAKDKKENIEQHVNSEANSVVKSSGDKK